MSKKKINEQFKDLEVMKDTNSWKAIELMLKKYRNTAIKDLLDNDTKEDRAKKEIIKFISFVIQKPEELHNDLEIQMKVLEQQEETEDLEYF